jgi:nucleoside-diphosphate-sugar epimerase
VRGIGTLVLVTGASGFVGRALSGALVASGTSTRCAFRSAASARGVAQGAERCVVGDIGPDTDWSAAVAGVDTIVHLAARVHVQRDPERDPLAEYRAVNTAGTAAIARSAVAAGVRRLVYVSSIKVNGEATHGVPFRMTDAPAPVDAYGISKWEAERILREAARSTGMEVVIVRPPLVYGPGARANFMRLMRLVRLGLPIPLGAVDNRRSLVALDNLVDLLRRCVSHPGAPGNTFLVSDAEDLSTPELIRRLARAMGTRAMLLPVPQAALRVAGQLLGKSAELSRLLGSLQVDIEHTCRTLDWTPPMAVDQALRRSVRDV